jgi:hypothetical protein
LVIDREHSGYNVRMPLSEVKVFGVTKQPIEIRINDQVFDNFVYDDSHNTLKIQYFSIDMNARDSTSITWSY